MKKLLLLCACVVFIGIETLHAQSEPGKRETFNYIVDLIEGACKLSIITDFTVISRDENDFKVTILGKKSTNNYSMESRYYLEFKNLTAKSYRFEDGGVRFMFNKKVKILTDYSNGNTADFSNKNHVTIKLCNSENEKRLVKALKHFYSLQNKTGSFFDD